MSMRYLSVCSGIESASTAWHSLGWSPVAFAEIEPFPSAVLAHHFDSNSPGKPWSSNGVPNYGDMTRFQEWPDHAIDVLVGGTPCQSFSVAGLRKGLDDPRGNLMLVYGAIARRYRPAWVVWENVPGVLSDDGGRSFASLLGLLSGNRVEVPAGGWRSAGIVPGYKSAYGLAWRVLDAQYVRVDSHPRAVPQRRRRVFVVGYLGDWRRAAAVLFERAGLSGDSPPRREARQDVAGALGAGSKRSGGRVGRREAAAGHLVAFGGNNQYGPIDVATAQTAHGGTGRCDFESETFVAHALRAYGFDASEDGTGRGTPILANGNEGSMGHAESHANAGGQLAVCFDETQITSATNRCQPQPGDACHLLAAGARPPTLAFHARQDPDSGPVTHPLDTDGSSIGVLHGWRVRRLTPTECERLQGFPDGHTAITYRNKAAADGPRYKALGNSKAVNVVRWIGQRIEMVDAIPKEAA